MENPDSLNTLLAYLDSDKQVAAEKYLVLQEKLTTTAEWKGVDHYKTDEVANEVLDRVTKKLEKGEEIKKINSYALGVLRLVVLEHFRGDKEITAGDDLPEKTIEPEFEEETETDVRLKCLRECSKKELSEEDNHLIHRYYDPKENEKNKENRKKLAEESGITYNNLKVKTRRIRERLGKCINKCVRKKTVTDLPNSDTSKQGGI